MVREVTNLLRLLEEVLEAGQDILVFQGPQELILEREPHIKIREVMAFPLPMWLSVQEEAVAVQEPLGKTQQQQIQVTVVREDNG